MCIAAGPSPKRTSADTEKRLQTTDKLQTAPSRWAEGSGWLHSPSADRAIAQSREFETEHVSFRQCLTASLSAASSQVKRQVRYQAVSGHFSRPRGVSGRISDARHANGTGPRLPLSSLSPLQEGPQRIRRGLRVVRHAKLAPERIELVGVRLRPRNPLLSGLLLGGIGQARGDHLHGTDVVA